MQVGCYSLELYCDNWYDGAEKKITCSAPWNSFPQVFLGETLGECRKQARKDGWRLWKDYPDLCPWCNGREKR